MNQTNHSSRRKQRADLLLVERGLAESRERAQALIMEGVVFVPSGRVAKSGALLDADVELDLRGRLPYVGRGGVKLAHALDEFGIDVTGLVALDVGASTGGFTDCLLQRGAVRVYAVDVGHGQLAYTLRRDPRVVSIEKLNARYPFELPELVDLLVIDVSFISLTLALPEPLTHLRTACGQDGERPKSGYAVALVKPQFEARRGEIAGGTARGYRKVKGGVIRSDALRDDILARVQSWLADRDDVDLLDTIPSPITGDAGNREFLTLLRKRGSDPGNANPPHENQL